tara:strand:- start:1628 stop:2371 length:744 start_codon:yes stop_codon:yes gene_type:complete
MKMYWYNTVDNLYKQDKTKFLKLVELKAQIIRDTMGDFTTDEYGTALVLGFNPILWALCKDNVDAFKYHVLCRDEHESEFIRNHEDLKHVTVLTKDEIKDQKFDVTLALDSYFTRYGTEDTQKQIIADAHGYTRKALVTTIKDFKNMKSVDRLVDPPMVINSGEASHVFVCHRTWDRADKQKFNETMYQLSNGKLVSEVTEIKRTLYFKQLAKYIHDLGCSDFKISQSLFYKNLFSRSYEYIAVAKI